MTAASENLSLFGFMNERKYFHSGGSVFIGRNCSEADFNGYVSADPYLDKIYEWFGFEEFTSEQLVKLCGVPLYILWDLRLNTKTNPLIHIEYGRQDDYYIHLVPDKCDKVMF